MFPSLLQRLLKQLCKYKQLAIKSTVAVANRKTRPEIWLGESILNTAMQGPTLLHHLILIGSNKSGQTAGQQHPNQL